MANTPAPLSFAPAFSALIIGAIAMGVSPIFVRFAEVGPFASAFWRAALALPILLIWAVIESKRHANHSGGPSHMSQVFRIDGAIFLAGLFFAGDLFFWHLSILNTTIANATLLACLAPVWVLLLSGSLIGEMSAYTPDRLRTALVVADEPSVLFHLTTEKLAQLDMENLKLTASIHELVARTLGNRITYMNHRLFLELK